MSQLLGIISLKCPNCGAGISVTPELDVFACGYCGAQQMVRRGGGIVSLKLIGEAIARVQHGTDRTAAELAIRRLRDELAALADERRKIESVITSGNTIIGAFGLGVIAGLWVAIMMARSREYVIAVLAAGFATFMAARAVKNVKTSRLLEYYLTKKLALKEADIKRQLEQHLGTVAQ